MERRRVAARHLFEPAGDPARPVVDGKQLARGVIAGSRGRRDGLEVDGVLGELLADRRRHELHQAAGRLRAEREVDAGLAGFGHPEAEGFGLHAPGGYSLASSTTRRRPAASLDSSVAALSVLLAPSVVFLAASLTLAMFLEISVLPLAASVAL